MNRIAFLSLLLFLAFTDGKAQETLLSASPTPSPAPEKKHLLFPSVPNPTGVPQSTMKNPLDAAIDNFFLALESGQVDLAYDRLVYGSIYSEHEADINTLKKKTSQALTAFGGISGYELVQEKKAGTVLVRRTYLSIGEKLPLRWRFYYYKTKDGWQLVDFRVDDGLVDLFDDISKPLPPPNQ